MAKNNSFQTSLDIHDMWRRRLMELSIIPSDTIVITAEQNGNQTFPKIRKVFPNEIAGVQPLVRPTYITETVFKQTLPKINGGTIEEYLINLIIEWNEFAKTYHYSTKEIKEKGIVYFTYLRDKLLQHNPNIYDEYMYTSYDYKVFEFIGVSLKYKFQKFLKDKPKEILFVLTQTGVYYLFCSKQYEKDIKLGGVLTDETIIETAPCEYNIQFLL